MTPGVQKAGAPSAAAVAQQQATQQAEERSRKLRRLNNMQLGPVRSLPMTMFMMWMAGSDTFGIMITGMAIYQPIQSMMGVGEAFKMFDGDSAIKGDVFRARLVYVLCCFVALACGLAKLHFMRLLPTAAADWHDHAPPLYAEVTSGHFFV